VNGDNDPVDPTAWSCPVRLREYPQITMAHGGGGQLGADLVTDLFLPAFGAAALDAELTDAAVLAVGDGGPYRTAFTTDAHVVKPLFFPGGNIGTLAVNGTVNDLAMVGAQPIALATAFVIEEGFELRLLDQIARSMGRAAKAANVRLVTGDTKVVEAGHGDGVYITTSGIGAVPVDLRVAPDRIQPGDCIIVSGPVGRHGIAVMSQREGLEFGTTITSDCAPLGAVTADLIAAGIEVHAMRDLTRGGLLAGLCELADAADVGLAIELGDVPVPDPVRAACSFLGLDPLSVANEGTFVVFVPASEADKVLAVMNSHPDTCKPAVIGTVVADHPASVVGRTSLGGRRVLVRPMGEQLPRIC